MGTTNQEIIINSSPDTVWNAIRNFHDLGWAPNVITSLEQIGEVPGDRVGAIRVLNGAFRETLRSVDEANKTFSYSIDDGPPPISKDDVSTYIGRVKVEPASDGNSARVEWTSSWEKNDEAAHDFCHQIYVALLADMKKSLE